MSADPPKKKCDVCHRTIRRDHSSLTVRGKDRHHICHEREYERRIEAGHVDRGRDGIEARLVEAEA